MIGLQYGVLRSVIFSGPNCPFSDKKRGLLMKVIITIIIRSSIIIAIFRVQYNITEAGPIKPSILD